MGDQRECYCGTISVELDELPSIRLESFNPNSGEPCLTEKRSKSITSMLLATQRRCFTLEKDWKIMLSRVTYMEELNGEIVIPVRCHIGEPPVKFDGASVPAPWLISFVSLGILRPLGVMLIASIVHDFAYQKGYLEVIDDTGVHKRVEVARATVDRLFRDIISTVNQLPLVGWIAWFTVRVGWIFGVKYDGKAFGGKPPHMILAALIVLISLAMMYFWWGGSFQLERIKTLMTAIFGGYFFAWAVSTVALRIIKRFPGFL